MNRRQALAALASGAAVSLTAADLDAAPASWLDTWASADIERILSGMGVWETFRRRCTADRKKASKRRRREARGEDVLVYRGPVTEPLPAFLTLRKVRASRRDVLVAKISFDAIWQRYDLPRGTHVVIDSRADLGDLGGMLAEIIDTRRGRRLHVWRGPAGRVPRSVADVTPEVTR